MEDLVGKIENGKKHWFTFVTELGVEPTTNRAGKVLGGHVVQRKIIGTLRNKKRTKIYETVMTLLTTGKQDLKSFNKGHSENVGVPDVHYRKTCQFYLREYLKSIKKNIKVSKLK